MKHSRNNKTNKIIFILCVVLLVICSCAGILYYAHGKTGVEGTVTDTTETLTEAEIVQMTDSFTEAEIVTEITTEVKVETTEEVAVEAFNIEEITPYEKKPSIEINQGIPFFTEDEKQVTEAFETYSDLDALGRCGVAYANIGVELMPTEERGEIGPVKPSGWHTVKYNDLIDGNYLYNRCHLIGYQLAGENANEKNLITGTRYLNVVGMLEYENQVSNYVKETEYHVLYRVTPIFEGENLVASGVLMEAWSVEDQGTGICFNVYCYNVQPGIRIDYATGESERINPETVTENTTELTTEDLHTTEAIDIATCDYVVNKNTRKIHLPICQSVNDMAEHNKWYYTGEISDLIANGYKPCQRCLGNMN